MSVCNSLSKDDSAMFSRFLHVIRYITQQPKTWTQLSSQRRGPESIKLFIEDQVLSPSYDLAPPQPLPSPSSVCCPSFSVFLYVAFRAYWWERGRLAGGAKSYDGEKAWSSIIYSKLFVGATILYTPILGPYAAKHRMAKTFICSGSVLTNGANINA